MKKYLVVYNRWVGNKYMGQFINEESEEDLKAIEQEFDNRYYSDLELTNIYEIKQDVTLDKIKEITGKIEKENRNEDKIKKTIERIERGY